MNKGKIKAWITKYALTEGIEVVDAEVCGAGNMITYGNVGYGSQYAHGKDWHRTPEEAIARAEEMRTAKIASLRKNIEKMEALEFKAPNAIAQGREHGERPSGAEG